MPIEKTSHASRAAKCYDTGPCVAAFQEEVVSTEVILLIIGVVLSLPGGLFVAGLSSMARAKWAALFGGILGAVVVALAILVYVNMANISVEGLSYFYGVFFASSVGVFLGALLVNFLVGLVSRSSSDSAVER
jgi:putative effector of murein hydrolase